MSETSTIVVSIVGAPVGIAGVLGVRLRSLATNTRRIDVLMSEMHQRFDRVRQDLGENRERMAKLEGSI